MKQRGTILRAIPILILLALAALAAPANDLERARVLYQKTQYREALRLLEASQAADAASLALLGKTYYMLGEYKKATESLEKAVAAAPQNADYYDWLGKIYGRRAETSSPLTAWSYATKCHKNFERALELDPKNLEAIDDLFEYSLNAPGFVGGGTDKAANTAEKARDLYPGKYYSLLARMADKQKEYYTEEVYLKKSLEATPASIGRILDMAHFLARQKRYDESEAMFERAKTLEPENPELKFERAKSYIETGRKREEARRLLTEYLNSSLTPDDPPRSEAEELLKKTASS